MADVQLDNGFTRIANDLINALCHTNLSAYDSRVFMSIIRLTYGWNQAKKNISVENIMEITGIKDKRNVSRSLASLTAKRMILRNGVTGIQKDYTKWSPSIETEVKAKKTPSIETEGSPSIKTEVSPSIETEVSPSIETEVLLVKDTSKDTSKDRGADKPLQPHQEFVKNFGTIYTEKTCQPFQAISKHFIMAKSIIDKHGMEACIQKVSVLANLCADGAVWPAKNGWADFTIENLIRNWNSLIPQVRIPDQEMKNIKLLANLKKLRENDERIKREIDSGARG